MRPLSCPLSCPRVSTAVLGWTLDGGVPIRDVCIPARKRAQSESLDCRRKSGVRLARKPKSESQSLKILACDR